MARPPPTGRNASPLRPTPAAATADCDTSKGDGDGGNGVHVPQRHRPLKTQFASTRRLLQPSDNAATTQDDDVILEELNSDGITGSKPTPCVRACEQGVLARVLAYAGGSLLHRLCCA